MKTNNRHRIALVGAGTHGRNAVIPGILNTREFELVAVADLRQSNLDELGEVAYGRYLSVQDMLAKETLDVLYVATLPETHCELTLLAFRHGVHVVCEKPLASTVEESERMVQAAREAGKELVVMFENRFQPYYQKIREWIVSGRLGRVEAIHIQTFGKHPLGQPRRTNLLNAAGCLDCGIHMLDIVRFWNEGAHWKIIHALGTWFDEPVEKAPHMGILAQLDNGVMVTFEDSFSYGYRLKSQPNTFKKNNLTIVGTEGVITDVLDDQGNTTGYELITDEGREQVAYQITYHYDEIPKVLDHFAGILNGTPEPWPLLPRGTDGLEAQRIVDEVNRQCVEKAPLFAPNTVEKIQESNTELSYRCR